MATGTLTVSGNHVYSLGTISYIGGSTNYTCLNDADDNTYALCGGSNGYVTWPLTDTVSNMSTITDVTINMRMGEFGAKGDQVQFAGVQIFKSDGTTAITSNCTAASGFAANFNLTPSSIFYTDKTSWDGAVVKCLNDAGSDGSIAYYELSVSITYTTSSSIYNQTGSGGAIAAGTSNVNSISSRAATGGVKVSGISSTTSTAVIFDIVYDKEIIEIPTAVYTGSFSDILVDKRDSLIEELKLNSTLIVNRRVVR